MFTLRSPPLTTSKRIFKSYREYLKLFDPAFRLLVTVQNIWRKQKQPLDIIIFLVPALESKYRVFKILGISLEIPTSSNSRCEKPSISDSKCLVFRSKICDNCIL